MAMEKNKVKFGLKNVHWAKITGYDEDEMPIYGEVKKLPGAVNLSLDPNGENEPFYADDGVYYVCSNNAGYEGDLEIALVTTEFATEILGEKLDAKGVLVETSDAEMSEFALFFEFTGDKNKIRHIFIDVRKNIYEFSSHKGNKNFQAEKQNNQIKCRIQFAAFCNLTFISGIF